MGHDLPNPESSYGSVGKHYNGTAIDATSDLLSDYDFPVVLRLKHGDHTEQRLVHLSCVLTEGEHVFVNGVMFEVIAIYYHIDSLGYGKRYALCEPIEGYDKERMLS